MPRTECIAQQPDYDSQPLYTNRQLIDLYFCYLWIHWNDIRYIKYTFCRIFYRVVFVVFSIRLELLRNTVRNFDRNEERQDKVAEMNVNNISILFRIIKLHFISWTGLISYIVCQPVLWTLDFACTMYMRWRIQSWNPNCVPQHITSPWSL